MSENIWRPKGRTPRFISLTRVSVDAKGDSLSHGTQHAGNLRCGHALGAELYAHYEETVSGALYNAREETQRALEDLEADRADYLILYDSTRYGRSVRWQQEILHRIERAEKRVQYATFRIEYDERTNRMTDMARFMFNTLGNTSEAERYAIRERTIRGSRAKAEKGNMVARGYFPFGYIVVRNDDVTRGTYPEGTAGTYLINEEEANTVPVIFEKYIDLKSLRAVATWLTKNGYPTRKGGPWKPHVVRTIILNPVYKGAPEYGKRQRRVDESRTEKGFDIAYYTKSPKESRIVMSAPPLVEESVWNEANRVLEAGRSERSGPRRFLFPLTGLMRCPLCGNRMYAMKYRTETRTTSLERPHQFRCGQAWQYTKGHPVRCSKAQYYGTTIEQLVIDALEWFIAKPEMLRDAQKEYEREQKQTRLKIHTSKARDEPKRIEREIERLKAREKAAMDGALDARIEGADSTGYEQARRECVAQRLELEKRLEEMRADVQDRVLDVPDYSNTDCKSIIEALRNEEVSPAERAEMLRSFVDEVYVIPRSPEQVWFKRINLAGVSIVLKNEKSQGGPVIIVRNVVRSRRVKGGIVKTAFDIQVRERVELPIEPAPVLLPFEPKPRG